MTWVAWALVAMFTYGFVAVFLKLAFRGISPALALAVTNSTIVLVGVVWVLIQGGGAVRNVGWNLPTMYLALAGLFLAVSITSYYKALSAGEVSVVVPIFALSFAVAAIVGFALLGEPLRPARIAGILLAIGAIILLTR